ncbi:hypothetical protein NDU88_005214 [Pleurodeles waltl]|uniref:Uncharacterized protein n=1 Tax=Pleurodeles waltl TaxID=8319 RepID=A0AAV7TU59_PLEWA|nr:hypothetical protein NDU88_005214 [Pleurodeles waltl]
MRPGRPCHHTSPGLRRVRLIGAVRRQLPPSLPLHFGLVAPCWAPERKTEQRCGLLLEGLGRAGGRPLETDKQGYGQRTGWEQAVRRGQKVAEWTKVWPGGGRQRIPTWISGLLVLGMGPGCGPFGFRGARLVVRSLLGAPGYPASGAACWVTVYGCALWLKM